MKKSNYSELLKDPRWQKKRLEILERDEWMCQKCQDSESTLHVHHLFYRHGKKPWESENDSLMTLCESCHNEERDTRQEAEEKLLEVCKIKGMLASDIDEFANIFFGIVFTHKRHPEFPLNNLRKHCRGWEF